MDKNYFGITDTGKVRTNNEDTFIAQRIEGTDYVLACVIDGVGGYTGGEVAAAIAKKTVLTLMDQPGGDLSLLMQAVFAEANDQILAAKRLNKEYEDMACVMTLALADLKNNQFYYAHVGDTRLYLLRDDTLIKISKDQSFVGFMEDSGRLTEEQAMQHPKRNEINKALGFAGNIGSQEDYIETGHSPFLPGDLILLCSDGLSDMVNKQGLIQILLQNNNLEQKGIRLIESANSHGGLDNITAVLVKNDNTAVVHEATKPLNRPKKNKVQVSAPETPGPIQEQQATVELQAKPTPPKQSSKGLNPLVKILIFILLVAIAYFFWKRQYNTELENKHQLPDSIVFNKYATALKLQDTLDKLNGNILILDDSIFKSPILIAEPIRINRDSLYLKATGNITIKSDTGYRGQPFVIAPANKSTLLENFTLENFEDLGSLNRKGVLLKNVQFISNKTTANQNTK